MLSLETALYVRVQELPNGPKPLPLQSGFNLHTAYRALGMFNPSETSDAYFILSNDRNETWFICNRHLRTVALAPHATDFRRPLQEFAGLNPTIESTVGQPAHRPPGQEDQEPSPQPVEPDRGPVPAQPGDQPLQHGAGTSAGGYLMAPWRTP